MNDRTAHRASVVGSSVGNGATKVTAHGVVKKIRVRPAEVLSVGLSATIVDLVASNGMTAVGSVPLSVMTAVANAVLTVMTVVANALLVVMIVGLVASN
ncbi:hypothetical protein, partial [Schaalia suimastitidis]|uniref:hypothetical protein n=1 Tax=Schaalia suimastitidis TaxID=121163 RepID=UPI0013F3DE44